MGSGENGGGSSSGACRALISYTGDVRNRSSGCSLKAQISQGQGKGKFKASSRQGQGKFRQVEGKFNARSKMKVKVRSKFKIIFLAITLVLFVMKISNLSHIVAYGKAINL